MMSIMPGKLGGAPIIGTDTVVFPLVLCPPSITAGILKILEKVPDQKRNIPYKVGMIGTKRGR